MTPEERLDRMEGMIDKQNAGIRDFIVVSRTILNSLQESSVPIRELREAQASTDEKLKILIDTVDRIVRHRDSKQ